MEQAVATEGRHAPDAAEAALGGGVIPSWHVHTGDALAVLRSMPADSVHTCVTSPPYWGLRDYGLPPTEWADGWVGCLGLEPTPEMYTAHLVEVLEEVRRVLRPDGTLWLNLGDSYAHGGCGERATASSRRTSSGSPGASRSRCRRMAGSSAAT
jgi:hypothetical protein